MQDVPAAGIMALNTSRNKIDSAMLSDVTDPRTYPVQIQVQTSSQVRPYIAHSMQ